MEARRREKGEREEGGRETSRAKGIVSFSFLVFCLFVFFLSSLVSHHTSPHPSNFLSPRWNRIFAAATSR